MSSSFSSCSPPTPPARRHAARHRRLSLARPTPRRRLCLGGSGSSRLHCFGLRLSGSRLARRPPSTLAVSARLLGYSPPAAAVVKSSEILCLPLALGFGGFVMGGSSIGEGTLSLSDFVASAKALIEKSKVIDVDDSLPDWQWKPCGKMGVPSEEEGYLALEGVYCNPGGRQEQIEDSNSFDVTDIIRDDTWVQSSSESVHVYDYHAVYSFSYKVPVLYFQGHQAGGQLLTLDEIKEDLPSHSLKLLVESKWTFITREEHPHFSRPWFTLHPCGTSDCMKLLLEGIKDKDQQLQYLPAWLSVVGQAVGLKIPLELYDNFTLF